MKYLAFIFLLAISACSLEDMIPFVSNGDFIPVVNPPAEPAVPPDTCETYVHINSPLFLQGYAELDNTITDYWVLNVGGHNGQNPTYSDTVFAGQQNDVPVILENMIELYLPAYTHKARARADAKRISVITDGTETQSLLQMKVWIRAGGAKWWMSFNKRSFLFGGSVTNIDTFLNICNDYPSVTTFNLRDCNFDSLQEKSAMLGVLNHDLCKAGENRADFRFNNYEPSDSIVQAFQDAGWQNVLINVTGNPIVIRGRVIGSFKSEFLADTRGYNVTEHDILYLLDAGFAVVTDL